MISAVRAHDALLSPSRVCGITTDGLCNCGNDRCAEEKEGLACLVGMAHKQSGINAWLGREAGFLGL